MSCPQTKLEGRGGNFITSCPPVILICSLKYFVLGWFESGFRSRLLSESVLCRMHLNESVTQIQVYEFWITKWSPIGWLHFSPEFCFFHGTDLGSELFWIEDPLCPLGPFIKISGSLCEVNVVSYVDPMAAQCHLIQAFSKEDAAKMRFFFDGLIFHLSRAQKIDFKINFLMILRYTRKIIAAIK